MLRRSTRTASLWLVPLAATLMNVQDNSVCGHRYRDRDAQDPDKVPVVGERKPQAAVDQSEQYDEAPKPDMYRAVGCAGLCFPPFLVVRVPKAPLTESHAHDDDANHLVGGIDMMRLESVRVDLKSIKVMDGLPMLYLLK
jgi:hypothetical protein